MLNKKGNRGFILITSYMVITVLIILAIAFISKSVTESNLSRRKQHLIQALYLPEAGVDEAITQLRAGTSTADLVATPLADIGSYDCDWALKSGYTNRWIINSKGLVGDSVRVVRGKLRIHPFTLGQNFLRAYQIGEVGRRFAREDRIFG